MPTGWPGYTPATTGSSTNDGTPPLANIQAVETAHQTQMTTLGYDTTQWPYAQVYGNWTAQNVEHPERFGPPSQPTGVVIAASGTSGTGKVTWVPGANLPSAGYTINVLNGANIVATASAAPNATTQNVPGLTVSSSVTAVVIANGALVNVPSAASAAYTVV